MYKLLFESPRGRQGAGCRQSKLQRARFQLYGRQILQFKSHLIALAEIYTISDLNLFTWKLSKVLLQRFLD